MNKGYFPSFYSDIDELHRLTEKYRFSYVLGQWQAAFEKYASDVGSLVYGCFSAHDSVQNIIILATALEKDLLSE